MASQHRTLYTGVTNDLERRVFEHKVGLVPGFAKKYNCHCLVYFEEARRPMDAIIREKQIKAWRREKRVALIEALNPRWKDLSRDWTSEGSGSR